MIKRDKNIGSYQLANCFTGEDLRRYRTEIIASELRARIYHHLNVEKCERCRRLWRRIDLNPPAKQPAKTELSAAAQAMLAQLRAQPAEAHPKPPTPLFLEFGQLWTTHCRPKRVDGQYAEAVSMSRPVIIVSTGNRKRHLNNIIRALPLSDDTDFQWRHDSVLLEQNPLGFPMLAEIFNEQPMLAGNLRRYAGQINEQDIARIQQVREQFMDQPETDQPDEAYGQWKRIELDAVTYLAAPVNHALQNEVADAEVIEFPAEPIRWAASAAVLEKEQTTVKRILKDGEGFELSLRQIADQAWVRLYDESDHPPGSILVDGCEHKLASNGPDIYEHCLGPIARLTEVLEIQIEIKNRGFVFYGKFVCDDRQEGGDDD